MPVTASLLGLQGTYLSDWGLISAGTITAAIPTLIVFLLVPEVIRRWPHARRGEVADFPWHDVAAAGHEWLPLDWTAR